MYAGVQIFIQLIATLTKLCHIKRDHHNVLKMSTIDRNCLGKMPENASVHFGRWWTFCAHDVSWVVMLNMA